MNQELRNLSNKDLYARLNDQNNDIIVDLIKQNTIVEMKRRLKEKMGSENYDLLIQDMKNNKIIITGSFIIQCMLEEVWAKSDIDICYITNDTMGYDIKTPLFIDRNDFSLMHYPSCMYEDFLGQNIGRYCIYKHRESKQLVQILYLYIEDIDDPMKYLESAFDFDICKNFYYFDKKKENIDIHNIHAIMNKKISWNFTLYEDLTKEEIKEIKNIYPRPITYFSANIYIRMEKYKDRGFSFDEKEYKRIENIVTSICERENLVDSDHDEKTYYVSDSEFCNSDNEEITDHNDFNNYDNYINYVNFNSDGPFGNDGPIDSEKVIREIGIHNLFDVN